MLQASGRSWYNLLDLAGGATIPSLEGDGADETAAFYYTITETATYAVPEPGTAPLFAAGIAGLLAMGGNGRVWRRVSR